MGGARPPGGSVRLNLAAGAKRTLTSVQLEQGAEDVCGRFGAGSGKWQLFVSADRPVETMGLGHDETGLYENLSRAPSTSDRAPSPGGSFTLPTTVRNDGDASSAATTLRYYRSADATISESDTAIGSDGVPVLGASRTSGQLIELDTAPWTLRARAPTETTAHASTRWTGESDRHRWHRGQLLETMSSFDAEKRPGEKCGLGTYHYGACVDAVEGESDTGNNCSTALAVTVRAGPVLVATGSASDAGPLTGGSFTLSATVRNQGHGSSPATTLRYYRSRMGRSRGRIRRLAPTGWRRSTHRARAASRSS